MDAMGPSAAGGGGAWPQQSIADMMADYHAQQSRIPGTPEWNEAAHRNAFGKECERSGLLDENRQQHDATPGCHS